jgi:hypothetical protein
MHYVAHMIRSAYSAFAYHDEIAKAFYGIACIYALRGNKRLALQFLEKSLQPGFKDISQILNNSDMRTIRQENDWRRLIRQYS